MNKKIWTISLVICLLFFLMMNVAACKDEIVEIEEKNMYSWQKYMNEQEYGKIEEGMSYLEVVRITGGAGKETNANTFEWNDELLLTKGYRLIFEEDALIKKEIVERRGNSTR